MAALYALGALSQLEACAFEVHVREGCAACETELKEFEQVVGVLGSTTTPVAPPAYLRDVLAARIDRETPEMPPAPATVIPFPEQAGVAERRSAPISPSSSRVWLPLALAAALLIAFGYTFTQWQSARRSSEAATIEQNKELASAVAENARLKEQVHQDRTELAQVDAVLSSPRWRIIPLEGQDPVLNSSAKIYWDVEAKRWVVIADLPPAPEGKVYQIWFVTPGEKISAGLLRPGNDGHGFTVVELPPIINQLTAAAITLEPEGGSEQPTMPIYALGKTA